MPKIHQKQIQIVIAVIVRLMSEGGIHHDGIPHSPISRYAVDDHAGTALLRSLERRVQRQHPIHEIDMFRYTRMGALSRNGDQPRSDTRAIRSRHHLPHNLERLGEEVDVGFNESEVVDEGNVRPPCIVAPALAAVRAQTRPRGFRQGRRDAGELLPDGGQVPLELRHPPQIVVPERRRRRRRRCRAAVVVVVVVPRRGG